MTTSRHAVSALLVASAINLAAMVPGGPIEARDFSAISPVVLGAFNLFLTLLGLGSLLLAYRLSARRSPSYALATLLGTGYFTVYLLDLAAIFPTSPTPMPLVLWCLEWLGTALAIPLVILAWTAPRFAEEAVDAATVGLTRLGVIALVLVVAAIVGFATKSAMGL